MTVDQDAIVGGGMAAAGSIGLTIQLVTDFAHLGVVLINILLGLGGLYLMWPRIRKRWQESRGQ